MNKGRGVPFSVAGVVTSTCRGDLLLFTGETDVLEGAGLDEPMAKLLIVAVAVCQLRGSRSEAAKDGVAGTAPVRWRVAKLERQR